MLGTEWDIRKSRRRNEKDSITWTIIQELIQRLLVWTPSFSFAHSESRGESFLNHHYTVLIQRHGSHTSTSRRASCPYLVGPRSPKYPEVLTSNRSNSHILDQVTSTHLYRYPNTSIAWSPGIFSCDTKPSWCITIWLTILLAVCLLWNVLID